MLASEDDTALDFSYLQELSTLGKGKTSSSEPKGQSSKKEVRSLPSKDAVQAVLDRKKKAEQEKVDAFKKDREKLLELRSHDRKAHKRVKAMITRTKGFSKAVVDDAKDLTTSRGEQQCDEDDYGYESTMSQQIFDKLTTQYSEMPEDERLKFKKVKVDNINDVKSRVLNSLKKQEEEEQGPRKRKRKHTSEQDGFINDGDPYDKSSSKAGSSSKESSDRKDKSKHEHKLPVNINLTNYQTKDNENFKYDYDRKKREEKERRDKEHEKEERRKKRMKLASQPPTLGFAELMKLAANKTKETDVKKGEDLAKEQLKEREALIKKKLNDRPLTAQEKAQQEEERLRKLRRQGKLPNLPVEKLKELKEQQMNKKEGKSSTTKEESKNHKESNGTEREQKKEQAPEKNNKKVEPKPEVKVRDRSKYFAVPGQPKPPVPSSSSSSNTPKNSSIPSTKLPNDKTSKYTDSKSLKSQDTKSLKSYDTKSKSSDAPYKTPDSKARLQKSSGSGSKVPDRSKGFGSSRPAVPSKGRQFPPPDLKPLKKPSGGRFGRVDSEDEDSEYDSEMDDFIDDGEDELDYSSEIKKMFGYDKSRFKDEPEDVDDMEVGFGQVEREEMRSAKLGLMEDLEDMKQEEEERKRKLMKKKIASKGRR